jgi:hypothetical protein
MEGGVALFLLFILAVVIGIGALVLYLGGGALLGVTDRKSGKRDEDRPVHARPTSPMHEKVELAGTGRDDDEQRTG